MAPKFEKKTILAGIENRIVLDIDFGILFGSLLEPKISSSQSNFYYTFENLCQGGSKMAPGGSWTILGRLRGAPGLIFGPFLIIFGKYNKS